ncbi:hypothetical protein [Chitinimonas taiwanensis]|uniref:Uncharacterized protein n=1 Tax=Chitinimonas taiwanensis DSM 18899 TaxID=1121279 RepID=A0A1K2HPU4_9NEIS|nr:hypothetical protein [Chitinimonas taiwanensis]SFZ78585.1 hypothetical protein SAMN02745887_03088 [Chitinimonas taiwanensis DSM 18899]
MSTVAFLLYSIGIACVIAVVQMRYSRDEKVDIAIMTVAGLLCLGGAVASTAELTSQ